MVCSTLTSHPFIDAKLNRPFVKVDDLLAHFSLLPSELVMVQPWSFLVTLHFAFLLHSILMLKQKLMTLLIFPVYLYFCKNINYMSSFTKFPDIKHHFSR